MRLPVETSTILSVVGLKDPMCCAVFCSSVTGLEIHLCLDFVEG